MHPDETIANPVTPREPLALLSATGRRAGWPMLLRGVIAVIFGIIALRRPDAAATAFVAIFAAFAFADGILDFVIAVYTGRMGLRWGWYAFAGIATIAAGVVALMYPAVTLLALVILIGIRAVMLGAAEIASAISWKELDSRWLLGLAGLVSIVFGCLLFASPMAGGLALLWTIGIYAIIVGVMMFVFGVRVVSASSRLSHTAAA